MPGPLQGQQTLMDRTRRQYRWAVGSLQASLTGDARIRRLASAVERAPTAEERGWIDRIESLRTAVERRTDVVPERTRAPFAVGEIARRASQSPESAARLLRLVRAARPRLGVELGTCVGISAAYQAAGMAIEGGGTLVTLEGYRTLCDVSRANLTALGLAEVVEVRRGRFHKTLPKVVRASPDWAFIDGNHTEDGTWAYFETFCGSAEEVVLVFDDIAWSPGMERAWSRIRSDPRTRWAHAVDRLGICVVGPPLLDDA